MEGKAGVNSVACPQRMDGLKWEGPPRLHDQARLAIVSYIGAMSAETGLADRDSPIQ